ncbi:MAG: diguanylate cyclase [Firmicutes bacterium]|nr:diguanylate cyclase [Alicyclobacillaceae bacterium]MCL6497252.1 diguanylate cyclase [Bacillota bacterium]
MQAAWILLILGVPMLWLFHWGIELVQRNPRSTISRWLFAEHLILLAMLFTVLLTQLWPAGAYRVAVWGLGTLGAVLTGVGIRIHLQVLRWERRWPRWLVEVVTWVWMALALFSVISGLNLYNVDGFVWRGFWWEPIYGARFHRAMEIAVVVSSATAIGLGYGLGRATHPNQRGRLLGLFWGALTLIVADLVLGVMLPASAPPWLPPYPYLAGMLVWIALMRRTVTRYALVSSRAQRYQTLFSSNPAPMVLVDPSGEILDANAAAVQLVGRLPTMAEKLFFPTHRDLVQERLRTLMQGEQLHNAFEAEVLSQGGERRLLAVEAEAMDVGEDLFALWVLRDVTEERANTDAISRLAYQDSLTGLANPRYFRQRLREMTQGDAAFAVLLVDLDDFKHFNDTHGHRHGDWVLSQVGQRLQRLFRPGDVVARLGGDEFGVLVQNVNTAGDAQSLLARLLAAMGEPLAAPGLVPVRVRISAGLSRYPEDGLDGESLLHAADLAMYAAKRSGKDGWRLYDTSLAE